MYHAFLCHKRADNSHPLFQHPHPPAPPHLPQYRTTFSYDLDTQPTENVTSRTDLGNPDNTSPKTQGKSTNPTESLRKSTTTTNYYSLPKDEMTGTENRDEWSTFIAEIRRAADALRSDDPTSERL
ncbi:hypothetical protein ElyMa_001151000 [Elysia marginata]|uniref:Uncharacterized protein n=1 Tax=Elysia marginata TaxID=1093978 RepID=A0AAV4I0I2_9GAST|nr:hypothetical protein ElyMa_001151000 [Elysia marginata]